MGRAQPDDLKDLASSLGQIRKLPGLTEKSIGVFYHKSTPFLHFHTKAGVRWADVKTMGRWTRFDIDFAANEEMKSQFIAFVGSSLATLTACGKNS